MNKSSPYPKEANAALVLADGTVLWGKGVGAEGTSVGEVVFNTGLTGYQEVLTDPSYAGQIITFTFPHIGNVGTNNEDIESLRPAVRGMIVRSNITAPANWRSNSHLDEWLKKHSIIGIAGLDTRAITRRIRDQGAPNGVLIHSKKQEFDLPSLLSQAKGWQGLEGMDLVPEVTCQQPYHWNQSVWQRETGYAYQNDSKYHVVAVDFGIKHNILRCLANAGCKVTVVPATITAEELFSHNPDGIFLSNGPGDPAATGIYTIPMIQAVMARNIPLFGICLGHQILALALGGKTRKMQIGHRGANHPVKDLVTDKVEITSQNHGFVVIEDSLPQHIRVTHRSLFDGSVEGLALDDCPVFSVQYHPEASPGPQDSHYLFDRFISLIEQTKISGYQHAKTF